jgi:hypothetical protein
MKTAKSTRYSSARMNNKGTKIKKSLSKKEKKQAKMMCNHIKLVRTKHGKVKKEPTFVFMKDPKTGEKVAVCAVCGRTFRRNIFTKDEVKQRMHDLVEVYDQAAYASEASGQKEELTDMFASTRMQILMTKKKVNRMLTLVNKEASVNKKRKKGNNNRKVGTMSYGDWLRK